MGQSPSVSNNNHLTTIHDHQNNSGEPAHNFVEETTEEESPITPNEQVPASQSSNPRRQSLPSPRKQIIEKEDQVEEDSQLKKAFKSATNLDEKDLEHYSIGIHILKRASHGSSDENQDSVPSSSNIVQSQQSLKINSKRNHTLPLTITAKENESPVHRSNTHPHLSSRIFQEKQPVSYSNNPITPNSTTNKTSQKLLKVKPFSTPDLKRSALLNTRTHTDDLISESTESTLTPTTASSTVDEMSFNSTSVYSPPQNAPSYRHSIISSTSSGGSSNNQSTHNNNNSLIHSLFPSLPVDRSKMTDDEFNLYKDIISKPVYEKILKSKSLTAKCGFNEEYMKEFAFELSDEEELKKTYLTTDWVETAKLLQRTRSIDESTLVLDRNTLMEPISTFTKRDSLSSIEEEVNKIVSQEQEFLKQEIKIKLIITEIASNSSTKTLRQFLSPVLHKMNVLPEIGWFHSAILVGKWRLDFNDSSVVIPRKLVSQAAVITTDIESITTLEDLNRVIDGMSRCICKWNRNILYKQTNGDRVTTGNCQDFVEDLLESIGVKMKLSGSMRKFVKRLRKTGKCSLVFEMDKRFREHFGMDTKRVKFKSHEQLDLFVRKLLEKCPNFAQEFSDEWNLLQSFDRTYWLKHITYTHIEEYKPCKVIRDNKGVQDCPFHEPEFISLLKD